MAVAGMAGGRHGGVGAEMAVGVAQQGVAAEAAKQTPDRIFNAARGPAERGRYAPCSFLF